MQRIDAQLVDFRWRWQAAAWIAALAVAFVGMADLFAEWSPDLATTYLVWLCLGVVAWFLVRQRRDSSPSTVGVAEWTWLDTACAAGIGSVALSLSIITAAAMGPLPPAYHDEYSYLFGAQTLLSGRVTWPSLAP